MYVFKDLHNLPSLQNSREGKREQHFGSLSSVGVDLLLALSSHHIDSASRLLNSFIRVTGRVHNGGGRSPPE